MPDTDNDEVRVRFLVGYSPDITADLSKKLTREVRTETHVNEQLLKIVILIFFV